jgi:drug/metabolite transporter (DMT)-like permease
MYPDLLGMVLGLSTAFFWGSGDFSGGLAARRHHPSHVLVVSLFASIVLLATCAFVWRESFPSLTNLIWASLAAIGNILGLATLYHALAVGHAARVAPLAAVTSASVPVAFAFATMGLPTSTRVVGFLLALVGVWFASTTTSAATSPDVRRGVNFALLSGLSFGVAYILLGQVQPTELFTPLLLARCFVLSMLLLFILGRKEQIPSIARNPTALIAGFLEGIGTVVYLIATQLTRLDTAAVLASLYPGVTVLLASLILKERVTWRQWSGVGFSLAAVTLIVI